MVYRHIFAGCLALASSPAFAASGTPVIWTMESATQRVIKVAPELQEADAAVAALQEEAIGAGKWPNPSLDVRMDNRIGQITGQGGTSLSQSSISQPLPFRRISHQRAAAEFSVKAAQANRRTRLLGLELEAARAFYAFQFAVANHRLTEERLRVSQSYIAGTVSGSHDRLKRYLTPLERERIAIMAEDARQGELLAQRDEENARIEFRSLLSLTGSDIEMAAPDSPTQPPPLKTLEGLLDRHPAVEAAQQEIEAANEGIEVAKSQRYAYPVLKLFRDREVSATGEVVPVNGIGISVEVPLWNRNRTPENKARAEVDASAARLQKVRRDTRTRLELSYAQLSRQLELAERMHRNLVEPARRMFELTQRSFAAGESNILALVDANNVYFDARARYLDLLHDAWFEAAKLRLASGVSVINPSMETLP